MKKNAFFLLVGPISIILAIVLFLPLISVLVPTFLSDGQFSLQAYIEYFQDPYYVNIFLRTLRVSVICAVICTVLGVPTAYYISRANKKIRGVLMAISIFPLLTNSVIRAFAWISVLSKNGIINQIIQFFDFEPVSLLYTEFSVLIGTIYLFLPLMIITLVGVMENIGDDMLEAAESLGASRLVGFFKVILPMSIPGIITGFVLVFTGSMTAYTTPQLLGGPKNMMMSTLIYQRAYTLNDWTSASVIALIMIVSTMIVMKGLNAFAAKLDRREGKA